MKEALLETEIMLLMVWTFQILVLLLRLFYFEGFTAVSCISPHLCIMLQVQVYCWYLILKVRVISCFSLFLRDYLYIIIVVAVSLLHV